MLAMTSIPLLAILPIVAPGLVAPIGHPIHPPTLETTVDSVRATGTFDVNVSPLSTDAAPLGRMGLDKEFHGDLAGTSKGEMLTFQSDVEGSAGYVAMERVTGTLHGRSGTFVLQHSGTMERGAMHLQLTVVPDSGTGELTGLAGSMQIIIEDGQHSYVFDYTLP